LARLARLILFRTCATAPAAWRDLAKLDLLDCAGRFCGSLSPVMKTVAEYRAYAAVCQRLMARVSRPEDKQALETVARAWEQLADEREDRLLKQIDGDTLID
jgi:hypothetical protein